MISDKTQDKYSSDMPRLAIPQISQLHDRISKRYGALVIMQDKA
jgi:hypothetical protein